MIIDQTRIAAAGDHLEVMDALLRFGAGVDHHDVGLTASAFSDDAVVDFGPGGQKMGLEFPVLTGGEMIVQFLGSSAGTRTTTHAITNGRGHVEGDAARLRALVDATHFPRDDHSRRCEMMSWYEAEFARDGRSWRIRRLVIDNAWFTGDPQVLLGK